MNKKQKNRKEIAQNKRNKMINRRYSSTIKTLNKFFNLNVTKLESIEKSEEQTQLKEETFKILSNLYSILDKAVKKNVLHKNNAARKKSRISRIFSKF